MRIEVARGLVAHQKRRAVHDGARDGNTLLLATGKLVGALVELVLQANQAQNLGNLSLNHMAALADNLKRERNVLENGFVRQQFEVLENAADVAAKVGHTPVAHGRKVFVGNINMAARWLELAGNELDKGRLARTRMANEEDELARIDL